MEEGKNDRKKIEGPEDFKQVESKFIESFCNRYEILPEEMGRMLGLGSGQKDVVAQLIVAPSTFPQEKLHDVKSRIGMLISVFAWLHIEFPEDKEMALFLRQEIHPGIRERIKQVTGFGDASSYTFLDLLVSDSEDSHEAALAFLEITL